MTDSSPPTTTPPKGIRALVVQIDGTAEITKLPGLMAAQVQEVQRIVGGYFQALGIAGGDWIVYINEDGKDSGLPINLQADVLARTLGYPFRQGDFLVGAAVFLGRRGSEETDVPAKVLELARASGVIA